MPVPGWNKTLLINDGAIGKRSITFLSARVQ